jgi:hypothetical protein
MIRWRMGTGVVAAVSVAIAAALGFAVWARARALSSSRDLHPFVELRVPRVRDPIPIDAETVGKKVWESEAGSTGVFKDDAGKGLVPYTEAKARWLPGTLYLLLYAGDLDLEGTVTEPDGAVSRDDSFHIELGRPGHVYTLDVSVLGTIADADCAGAVGDSPRERRCDARWDSRAVVAVDRDGTLNRLGDNDEEWVVEMGIPLAPLGLEASGDGARIPFSIRRCEIGKNGPGACGGFGDGPVRGEIVLEPDTLEGNRVARGPG